MKSYRTLSTFMVSVSLMLTANAATFISDATYYAPSLGTCGRTNQASDLVVALPVVRYGNGENCFKNVGIQYAGKLIQATVVDTCPMAICGPNDIKLSRAAFSRLADLSQGRITVEWEFL